METLALTRDEIAFWRIANHCFENGKSVIKACRKESPLVIMGGVSLLKKIDADHYEYEINSLINLVIKS